MKKSESENLKLFESFMQVSCFFGIGKFKSHKRRFVEIIFRLYSLTLAIIFGWIAISNHVNNVYSHFDGLIRIARGIDRSELILMAAALCFEASIRKKQDFKVIDALDRLDEVLSQSFDVKINYKLLKTYNLFLALIIIVPPILVARQFFVNQIGLFYTVLFSFFIFAQFLVAVVKTMYLSFIVAFLVRFKALKKLLIEKGTTLFREKLIFIGLSCELFKLVESFNESFGFTALMIIGEKKHCDQFFASMNAERRVVHIYIIKHELVKKVQHENIFVQVFLNLHCSVRTENVNDFLN